jgi:glutathione reductase (NADPH)
VPKKVLVAAAEALDVIARAGAHRIAVGPATLDWAGLIARKESFVRGVPESFAASLEKKGVEILRGPARFVGRNAVEVGGTRHEARHLVIAAGSKPRPLGLPGEELALTSDDLLVLEKLPASLVFIGAGVIGLELAHVFARAGTRVTILELLPRALPRNDADAVDRLVAATGKLGIELRTGVRVERLGRAGGGVEVAFEEGGARTTIVAEQVANGSGRVADLDRLDLAAGGVEVDRGRVKVDRFLRSSSNPAVWVAGDALAGTPQLSAVATYEGRIVGRNIVGAGEPIAPDYASIPSVVFTVPPLATVGRTAEEAKKDGVDFAVHENDMHEWRSGRTYGEETAYAKVLVERGSDRIVGAHLVGHGAAETIHAFAFAMKHGVTATELRETVYAYPTFHSDLKFLVG